ncbi:TRAP transporter substrate-binding protein [Pseudoroseomonas cervicalis]|uniref:TRAP transporter substrate-binding protein n=1 Tax=Teichococcus cervicalis TaxID=204525 RepID=UPI002782518D|nr:TRAP transporter substrate-binding protein [Pseudoroseomonas cervicalis]MDQ1080037.1 TRAP-type C4-dicarboxylate transport system substrate-binding protein [Pseudoroseomonas cervicalis]
MQHLSRRTLLAAGAAGALASGLHGRAAQAQTRWQFATPYPDGNFHTRNVRQFVEEAQQASAGRLQIQLHTNAALLKMPEIRRGVQTGQVQLGEILISAYGNEDPFFELDGIPQLVTSYAQARKLAELSRPYIEARLKRTGITLLYMVPWPPSGFYTNFPVDTIEALRGNKMRTFSAATNRFATLVGATPTLVQAAEVAQAFATGVVNSMVTSAATGVDVQAWDFAKFFTPIGFTWTKNAVFVQSRAFEALPAELRESILAAARTAETRGWEMSEAEQAAREKILADRGMTVNQPSEALKEGMAKVSETMVQEWLAKAGEDGRKLIEAYRAA